MRYNNAFIRQLDTLSMSTSAHVRSMGTRMNRNIKIGMKIGTSISLFSVVGAQ